VRIFTFANQLTIVRILLIPVFVLLVVYDYPGWALAIFVAAGVTDGLDGLIARRTDSRTSLGAWLDPMADKLLLVTTFVVLSLPVVDVMHHVPAWLTILIISRDIIIVGVVAIVHMAMGPRTFQPSLLGKLATGTYILTVVVFLLFNWLREDSLMIDVAVWCSLVFTLASGLDYIVRIRRLVNESPEKLST
jgi:cardiolipin synthase